MKDKLTKKDRWIWLLSIAILLTAYCKAQTLPNEYSITKLANTYSYPMQVVFVGDKMIVAEREGKIFIDGETIPLIERTPNTSGEGGILSILYFNQHIWIYDSSIGNPNYSGISLYEVDLENNVSTFEKDIFKVNTFNEGNHKGGTLMMYNDWLYLGIGDNTTKWSAQTDSSAFGKIIRIDPFTGEGSTENYLYDEENPLSYQSMIYAKGVRNPFRSIIHNGIIYCADVGAGTEEEIDIITETGQNLGWPFWEGGYEVPYSSIPINPDTNQEFELTNYTPPALRILHGENSAVLTNGSFVDFPYDPFSTIMGVILEDFGFSGQLLFMDYFHKNIIIAKLNGNNITEITDLGTTNFGFITSITQFNKDLYFTTASGSIYKIAYDSVLNIEDFEFIKKAKIIGYADLTGKKFKSLKNVSTGIYIVYYEYNGLQIAKKIVKNE